jgi:hypothetical protein
MKKLQYKMNATNNVLQTIVPHKSRGLQPKSATKPDAKIPIQIRKPVMSISVSNRKKKKACTPMRRAGIVPLL